MASLGPGVVVGDFKLIRELGSGGMGIVFEARQVSVRGRRVAVKVIRERFASSTTRERFQREIDNVGRLDHPGIVPVIVGGVEGDLPYYAMKYIEGGSLSGVIHELRRMGARPGRAIAVQAALRESGRLELREGSTVEDSVSLEAWGGSYIEWVAGLGRDVCAALEHAHRRGIIHRDIKPGNILVTRAGRPVLADFGLASGQGQERLTATGEFVGTLAYSAPEQIRGDPLDDRVDIHALGVTLYELLALRPPFDAPERESLRRSILLDDAAPLDRGVARDLDTICRKALRKRPEDRYQTAAAMGADLEAFLDARSILANPPGVLTYTRGVVRRHPRITLVLAGVVLALALSIAGGLWSARQSASEARGLVTQARQFSQEMWALHARMGQVLRELDESGNWLIGKDRVDHDRLLLEREAAFQEAQNARDEARVPYAQMAGSWLSAAAGRRGLASLRAGRMLDALLLMQDVLDPGAFREIQEALRADDETEAHAFLLDDMGRVALDTGDVVGQVRICVDRSGARGGVTRAAADEEFVYEAPTPLALTDCPPLTEGSYVAELSAEGHDAIRLPFLVRREAVYSHGDGMPPRELAVELPPTGLVPEGAVWVAGGWSLVGGDSLYWRWVDTFMLQRFECSLGEWVDRGTCDYFTRQLRSEHDSPWGRPRWDADLDVTLGIPMDVVEQDRRDHPARGLARDAVSCWLACRTEEAPSGWFAALPTELEWARAARGADGRRFPWGHEFRVEHVRSQHDGTSADLPPIGRFAGDESPFGIRDMAGSVAEWTRSPYNEIAGIKCIRGGSYTDGSQPESYETSRRSKLTETRLSYVGHRVLWRREEPALLGAWPFRDDFERPDSDDVGNGWSELRASPRTIPDDAASPETCRIDSGRLMCTGGREDSSNSSQAWQPVRPPLSGYRLRARVSVVARDATQMRAGEIGLRSSRRRSDGVRIALKILPQPVGSSVALSGCFSSPFVLLQERVATPWDAADGLDCVVDVRARSIRARVHPVDAESQEAVVLDIDIDSVPPIGFLTVTAGNFAGMQIAVDEIELREIP